jgi:hypothetical protein
VLSRVARRILRTLQPKLRKGLKAMMPDPRVAWERPR